MDGISTNRDHVSFVKDALSAIVEEDTVLDRHVVTGSPVREAVEKPAAGIIRNDVVSDRHVGGAVAPDSVEVVVVFQTVKDDVCSLQLDPVSTVRVNDGPACAAPSLERKLVASGANLRDLDQRVIGGSVVSVNVNRVSTGSLAMGVADRCAGRGGACSGAGAGVGARRAPDIPVGGHHGLACAKDEQRDERAGEENLQKRWRSP